LVLVETRIFTQQVHDLLSAEAYRQLQLVLIENPAAGVVIPGTGGARKLRWGAEGRGKQGGVRVIYVWVPRRERLYLLLIYAKNRQDDLTEQQRAQLAAIVREVEAN